MTGAGRWVLTLLLATVCLADCGPDTAPGPRTIDGGFPATAELPPLPFRLVDQTGRIQALAVVDPGELPDGVSQAPGRADAVHLLWTGGACDRRVLVTFEGAADEATFMIDTERDFGGCMLLGIRRTLLIEFNQPVDAATVSVAMVE